MHSFPIQGERQHGKAEAAARAERSDRSQSERGSFHTLPPSSSPPPVRRTASYGALGTTTLSEEVKQTEDRYTTAEEGEPLLSNDAKSSSRDSDSQKREDGRAGFAEDLYPSEQDFQPSKMRFVVAGVLFVSCALNCYIEYTFVAIWSIAIEAYQVGPLEINALALVFALFYVPGSIIAIGLYARSLPLARPSYILTLQTFSLISSRYMSMSDTVCLRASMDPRCSTS